MEVAKAIEPNRPIFSRLSGKEAGFSEKHSERNAFRLQIVLVPPCRLHFVTLAPAAGGRGCHGAAPTARTSPSWTRRGGK